MREIDVDQLAMALAQGAVLIDVREVGEYVDAHIPGAVSIPMGRLTLRLDQLDRSSPVHLVCTCGNRSSAMADLLTGMGFDAVDVAGGISAWLYSGRSVVRGAQTGALR